MAKTTVIPTSLDVRFIPHEQQRYPTVGDYYMRRGTLHVRISQCPNHLHSWLVLIHELVELLLCIVAGITFETIDEFDQSWRPHDCYEEPGDDPAAPYHRQHHCASLVERGIAFMLGVDWNEYERELAQLSS